MQPPSLPTGLLQQLEEHSSAFALFYFDGQGVPVLYTFMPELKDKMALTKFLMDYLSADMPVIDSREIEEDEGEDDDEG